MLWTIVVVLFILWLLGFSFGIGGSLIHLLLVVALAVVVINVIHGRRGVIYLVARSELFLPAGPGLITGDLLCRDCVVATVKGGIV